MMNKKIISLLLLLIPLLSFAQEFNCTVSVQAPQIQNIDKKIFQTMQQAIYEFVNNQKWSNDKYLNQERIEWTILITVSERISNDEFKGSIQVQSRRPVFQTSYNSPLFNYMDDNFQFKYVEFQPLEFNESGSNTNLTAVLAYYAYLVLGIDYDTFSLYGGAQYFAKAQTIVSNMQSAQENGWKAFEGTRNRYWLAENINSPVFKPYHEMMYNYHRKGLDALAKKKEEALGIITESIEALNSVHREKPGSVLFQSLFYAKADEIVNIYSGAFPDQKVRASNTLNEIDPANSSKYAKILAN
jgi:hypothetical protein